jgi:hypothetical protein
MIRFATLHLTLLPDCWNTFAFNNSIEMLSSDYTRLRYFRETYNTSFNDMFDTFDTYAFDGGQTGLGETVMISTGSLGFVNHACDQKSNFLGLEESLLVPAYSAEIREMWNPVLVRIRSELAQAFVAIRDVKRGEMITDDYSHYNGFMTDEFDETGHSELAEIKEWCG